MCHLVRSKIANKSSCETQRTHDETEKVSNTKLNNTWMKTHFWKKQSFVDSKVR